MIVGGILSAAAARWPNRPALVDEHGTSRSYWEWNSRVNQVANGLRQLGVGHGDRVAFCLRNVEALASAYMATQKLGAVAVPLNYRLSGAEIAAILNDCTAQTLIFEDHVSARVEQARSELRSVERFILVDGRAGGDEREGVLSFEALVNASPADEPAAMVHGDDLSVPVYTTGATGTPKAVMLTHLHQWVNTVLCGWELSVTSEDRTLHEVVAAGEVGELITRGPKVMLGYLNRPEQSARRLRRGWLYTGDLVYRDDDTYYNILDRLDDAISVGGELVHPKEIERVLDQHPKIKQSAVIGAPDPRWGQVIKAFVVPDGELSVQDIKDDCRRGGQLATFKTPRRIHLVDEIPTNPSGKALKRELRAIGPSA